MWLVEVKCLFRTVNWMTIKLTTAARIFVPCSNSNFSHLKGWHMTHWQVAHQARARKLNCIKVTYVRFRNIEIERFSKNGTKYLNSWQLWEKIKIKFLFLHIVDKLTFVKYIFWLHNYGSLFNSNMYLWCRPIDSIYRLWKPTCGVSNLSPSRKFDWKLFCKYTRGGRK